MSQELDNLDSFESHDTAKKLPVGWLILFFGLVAFGVVYLWKYTPSLGGWSQESEYAPPADKK